MQSPYRSDPRFYLPIFTVFKLVGAINFILHWKRSHVKDEKGAHWESPSQLLRRLVFLIFSWNFIWKRTRLAILDLHLWRNQRSTLTREDQWQQNAFSYLIKVFSNSIPVPFGVTSLKTKIFSQFGTSSFWPLFQFLVQWIFLEIEAKFSTIIPVDINEPMLNSFKQGFF